MILVLSQNRDFFLGNLWWIVILICFLGFFTYFLISYLYKNKKGNKKKAVISKTSYLDALGGKENIISSSLKGSRIILKLQDYTKLDENKLKEAGVAGFIEKSDQLTLVVPNDSKKVYDTIFEEEN